MKQTLRLAGKTPTVRYSLIFSALLTASMVPEFYLIQPFLKEHGLEVGWVFTALQAPARIATVFAAALAFWLAIRFGIVRTLASLPFWVVLVYAGVALVDSPGGDRAVPDPRTGSRRADAVDGGGYLNRRIPSHLRATALSLNHMGWALIMLPFPAGVRQRGRVVLADHRVSWTGRLLWSVAADHHDSLGPGRPTGGRPAAVAAGDSCSAARGVVEAANGDRHRRRGPSILTDG